ncbi:MAG TPA: LicD family protein [Chlamydiales bacterium]|nr:LicD family protein [Chlamydiales bacterium]
MWDRIWDFFTDSMMALFMPLVCSYFALSTSLFFNVSARDAKGLEWIGNQLLSPIQYLMDGREAVQRPDGTWDFVQRFNYQDRFWIKATASVFALPPSATLGTAVKVLSFASQSTRERFRELTAAKQSTKVRSNLEKYQKLGLKIGGHAEFQPSLGFKRRPGDESTLALEKRALSDVIELLNGAKIPWWVDCGTCVGAYRYGGVVPWDGDIDLAVLIDDFENVRSTLNQLDPSKYLVQDWSTRDHPNSYIKVFIRESGTMIDIYHFNILPESKELQFIFSLESNMFFPEWFKVRERRFKAPVAFDTVFPLKEAQFDGIKVFVPHDTKKYLQRIYGDNLDPVKVYDPSTGHYEKDLSHPYWQRAYAH